MHKGIDFKGKKVYIYYRVAENLDSYILLAKGENNDRRTITISPWIIHRI
jgi:hypothetical protein